MSEPCFKEFELHELAFFWYPKRWPEIVERFGEGRPGSSDIRDSIIAVDDEGGVGFLHWHQDMGAWALTDKGKFWVQDFLSVDRLRRSRNWKSKKTTSEESKSLDIELAEPTSPEVKEAPVLAREQELASLIAEQAADE